MENSAAHIGVARLRHTPRRGRHPCKSRARRSGYRCAQGLSGLRNSRSLLSAVPNSDRSLPRRSDQRRVSDGLGNPESVRVCRCPSMCNSITCVCLHRRPQSAASEVETLSRQLRSGILRTNGAPLAPEASSARCRWLKFAIDRDTVEADLDGRRSSRSGPPRDRIRQDVNQHVRAERVG